MNNTVSVFIIIIIIILCSDMLLQVIIFAAISMSLFDMFEIDYYLLRKKAKWNEIQLNYDISIYI